MIACSALALLVEHRPDVLAGEHDALEGVDVDLVELAAEIAEPDRQQAGIASGAPACAAIAGPAITEVGMSAGISTSTTGKKLVARSVAICVSGCIM